MGKVLSLILTSAAIVVLACQGAAAKPQDPVRVTLSSIAAQPLEDALRLVGRQTGLQIVYETEFVEGRQSRGAPGGLPAEQTLEHVLAGTGLTYKFLTERTVSIRPVQSAAREATVAQVVDALETVQVAQAETASPSLAAEGAPKDANEDKSGVQEIVVTAQRRTQSIKDVPMSISVLGGEQLDRSSYSTVNEVLRTIPGVSSFEAAFGAGMTKFTVRGVTGNDSTLNGSATTGYYLDEIPFAFVRFPMSPDVNAYDLERVEVLRGPQGTLYGANALNGVVRIMTKDANLNETELSVRTTLSSTDRGGENYRGDASLSVPVIPGKLAVRAVAGYADYSGWIDQPVTGLKDINDLMQKNLRLKVNAAPNENFGIELLSWFSRDDRGSHSTSLDNFTTSTTIPEAVGSKFDAFGLTLTYNAPLFSILSSTSYLDFQGSSYQDAVVDQALIAYGGELISEEIRLVSNGAGPWKWSIGGIYRDEEDPFVQDFTRDMIPGLTGVSSNVFKSRSFALYGELSRVFFDDKLELTAGLRYFEDESSSNELSAIDLATPFGERGSKFDAVTPRMVLSFRPNERATYYASYSEGFRSGFTQNGFVLRRSQGLISAVDPDRLTNYEIGTKGNVRGGRVTYELAAYYIDWKDAVQVLAVQIPNTSLTTAAAVNSKGIDGFGVDFAAGLELSERFTVDATFSWNDLALAEDVFSGSTLVYAAGSRPDSSPKMNAGAGFGYRFPSIAGYSTQFTGSANYTTEMLGPMVGGVRRHGDDFLVARVSLDVISPTGWSAMIFADNLTNEDGRIRAALNGPAGLSDRLRPRTIGVQLDYRF